MIDTLGINDKEDFKDFKRLYNKAKKDNITKFTYKGNPVFTQFAKYMIEYLTPRYNYK